MATATEMAAEAAHRDAVDRIAERIAPDEIKFMINGLVGHLADQMVQVEALEQRVVGLTVLLNKDNTRIGHMDARVGELLRRVARLEGPPGPSAAGGLDPGARSVMEALDAADDLARSMETILAHYRESASRPAELLGPHLVSARGRLDAYRRAAARAVQ